MTAATQMITRSRAEDATQESQLRVVFRRFRRHKLAMVSAVLLVLIFVVSLLAPVITTFPRDAVDVSSSIRPAPPGTVSKDGRTHILGIDQLGRDLYTRVLYAARVSLSIAILVVLLSESFGTLMGALAGYYGGRTDMALSRINEFMLTIPQLPILLIISAILLKRDVLLPLPPFVNKFLSALMLAPEREAQKVVVLILILVIFGWLSSYRLMRGMALSLAKQDFIEALRGRGRIRRPHHLPAHHPERPGAHPGERQPVPGRRDRSGIGAQLPGLGRAGSDADLGQYAGSGPELHVPASMDAADPRRFSGGGFHRV